MKSFHLNSYLDEIYSKFPEGNPRPIVGITANYEGIDATLRDRYYQQIVDAGGTPVIIPPVADKDVIVNTLENIDALLREHRRPATHRRRRLQPVVGGRRA